VQGWLRFSFVHLSPCPPLLRVQSKKFQSKSFFSSVPKVKSSFNQWIGPCDGFIGSVGNTPLIHLRKVSKETGCDILAKAEWMNPGGSIKDRAALGIIQKAEKEGKLKPGGTVFEGTAGNTGIGMAHICKALGYKLVVYMPNTQSKEKIDRIKVLGAEVIQVPVCPFDDPKNFNQQARQHSDRTPNSIWGNQFDNLANKEFHTETTGPEIWEQTGGRIHAWTCGTGTGGTFAGVSTFLKSKDPSIKAYVADPPGSVLYKWYTEGKLERTPGGSITEGIGQGRVTENMKGALVDGALFIDDTRTIQMVFDLFFDEGIFVGASSALNIVAAVDVAKLLGPGHTIVTMLCDSIYNYTSRLLSRSWLENKNLLGQIPLEYHSFLND